MSTTTVDQDDLKALRSVLDELQSAHAEAQAAADRAKVDGSIPDGVPRDVIVAVRLQCTIDKAERELRIFVECLQDRLDACPTCDGFGEVYGRSMLDAKVCRDCDGTGKRKTAVAAAVR